MARAVTVALGAPAIAALADEVARRKEHDAMAPVTVSPPSSYAGISLRRALAARGRGLVNVRFLALPRVAQMLGGPALARQGRPALPAAARAEAIRSVLQQDPGPFAPAANHPATVRAIEAAMSELRHCSEPSLDAIAASGARAGAVVRIARAAWRHLESRFADDYDLAHAAAAAVRDNAPQRRDVGHLIVFCPRTGAPPVLDEMVAAFADDATVIEGSLEGAPTTPTEVISAPDPDEEARTAIRLVMARLHRADGAPLHRAALLYGAADPYARLLHQQLAGAGIPFNGPGVRRLSGTVAGRALLGLLDLAADDWRRDELIGWVSSVPIDSHSRGGTFVAAREWDLISRRAGVVGGADQWAERISALLARLDATGDASLVEDDDAERDWRRERADRERRAAASLADFVSGLVTVATPPSTPTWSALAGWAKEMLDHTIGPAARHSDWPDDEQLAEEEVRASLGRLGALDSMGGVPDGAAFRLALEAELDVPAGRVGRFGVGVFVAPLHLARACDLDFVAIVGVAEGLVPGRGREDSLLPDSDRAASGGELRMRNDRIEQERTDLLAALASGAHERVMSFARAEPRSGRAKLPSRWLTAGASALSGRQLVTDDLISLVDEKSVRHVSSFVDGMCRAPEHISPADRDLATLAASTDPPRHVLVRALPRLARSFAASEARASSALTRFDGLVGPGSPGELGMVPVSPTGLETYAACPFRYFLSRGLGLRDVERPEDIVRLTPLGRGSLVHRILERWVAERIDGAARTSERLHEIAEEEFESFHAEGLGGRELFWSWDKGVLHRELDRVFDEEDADLTPLAVEAPMDSIEVRLDNGTSLLLTGRADRIDRDRAGALVITDYKTGKSADYKKIEEDPVQRGTTLQLFAYGIGAAETLGDNGKPVRARYWFVSDKGGFVKPGYELGQDEVARFREVAEVISGGIATGVFPARPGAEDWFRGFENCGWCPFDELCPTERDRAWERKRDDPAISAYVEMSEGDR